MKPSSVLGALALALWIAAPACKKATENVAPTAAGKRYAVQVDTASRTIRVTPEGGWKMNLEYEHRFEGKLRPAGTDVKVEKAAAKVSEHEVSFPIAAKAGESCEGSVFFAICTKSKCVPVEEKVSFSVATN